MILLLAVMLCVTACGKESNTSVSFIPAPSVQGSQDATLSIGLDASSYESSNPFATSNKHGLVPPVTGDVIEIKEKLFIAQTNDIYINGKDYLGKTIVYEGIFKTAEDWPNIGDTTQYVIRYGPGCCGYDGEAGFEVRWDGEWPQEDDWVEVSGVLCEEAYDNGNKILYLQVTALTVKEERGAEYVVA